MEDEDSKRGGRGRERRTPSPGIPEAMGSGLCVLQSSLHVVALICCLMILVFRMVVSRSEEGGPSGPVLIRASSLG